MTAAYARVMRSADGPESRRATRSRAPRRSGAEPGTVVAADTCADASGAPQDLPATPARAPGSAARAPGSAAEETFAAAAAAFMAGRGAPGRRGGREAGGGRGWMSVGAVSF